MRGICRRLRNNQQGAWRSVPRRKTLTRREQTCRRLHCWRWRRKRNLLRRARQRLTISMSAKLSKPYSDTVRHLHRSKSQAAMHLLPIQGHPYIAGTYIAASPKQPCICYSSRAILCACHRPGPLGQTSLSRRPPPPRLRQRWRAAPHLYKTRITVMTRWDSGRHTID